METTERARYLEILKTTPGRLKTALAGVPKKVVTWTPAPGKWSILQIVCHMRDMEREAYLDRFKRILAEIEPKLPDVDGDLLAIERNYTSQKLGDALRVWKELRKESLKLWRGLKAADWQRSGIHETAGRLTMEDFLKRQASGNDEAHLSQIEGIKRRFEALAVLESAPKRLAEAVRGAASEAIRRRPAPEKWSIVEHVCHLRDIETVYAERFTKAAFQVRPSFGMLDNDGAATALGYAEADATGAVKEFKRRREDTLSLLRALPQAVWSRTGIHPKRGEVSIEQMTTHLAAHDESHIARIRELALQSR